MPPKRCHVPHPQPGGSAPSHCGRSRSLGCKPALGLPRRRTRSRSCRDFSPESAPAPQLQQSAQSLFPSDPPWMQLWPGWLLWSQIPRERMWVLPIGPLQSFDDISFGLGRGIHSFKLTNLPNSSWAGPRPQPTPFLDLLMLIISPQIFPG